MIITIILGIIIFIVAIKTLLSEADCVGECVLALIFSVLTYLLIMLIGLCASSAIGGSLSANYTLTSSAPIVALKDDKITYGNFFLGCGGVDGDLRYYYAENSSRGYKVKSVDIDNCYILFDDEHPRVERYDADSFTKKRHYLYATPYGYYYKLYIPHGSITTEFKVDLE